MPMHEINWTHVVLQLILCVFHVFISIHFFLFSKTMNGEEADAYWILLCLHFVLYYLQLEEANLLSLLKLHILDQKRLNRSLPIEMLRPSWDSFITRTPWKHFHRMFRMEIDTFIDLSRAMSNKIGEHVFKSEQYLTNRAKQQADDALDYLGGVMCGELKLGMMTRMLAGGSHLDLSSLFYVGQTYTYDAFKEGVD